MNNDENTDDSAIANTTDIDMTTDDNTDSCIYKITSYNNGRRNQKYRLTSQKYRVPSLSMPCIIPVPKSVAYVNANRNIR